MAIPKLIAFDCYGTLVQNETDEWIATLGAIADEQGLGLDGPTFHSEWSKHEVNFRKTRTNMADPASCPPFRSYWEAWRDSFRETFMNLTLGGDADAAASHCVLDWCMRKAFPDTSVAIAQLEGHVALGVMSNADDQVLIETLQRNSLVFDPVISSEAAQAYKPDPRAFEAICTAASVSPKDVLYVGDSPYDDAHGAKLVGMRTVLINRNQRTPGRTPPPGTIKLLKPDFIVTQLTELPALLDSLG
jgi:2-haloalkanoic acid dehalogenase type II